MSSKGNISLCIWHLRNRSSKKSSCLYLSEPGSDLNPSLPGSKAHVPFVALPRTSPEKMRLASQNQGRAWQEVSSCPEPCPGEKQGSMPGWWSFPVGSPAAHLICGRESRRLPMTIHSFLPCQRHYSSWEASRINLAEEV